MHTMRKGALFAIFPWILTFMPLSGYTQVPPQGLKNGRVSGTQIIEYYGDSTVWGYRSGEGGQVTKPAPAVFVEEFPKTAKFEVRNEGVSGTTACQLLNGEDGKHLPWLLQMNASPAKYVILNFAINDQWKYDVDTYKTCLSALARIARKKRKHFIFETPNPTRDSGPDGLDVYVDAMRSVAVREHVPVIDQYRYLMRFLGGRNPYAICPDGIHPSEDIYAMKGRYAAAVLKRIIASDTPAALPRQAKH